MAAFKAQLTPAQAAALKEERRKQLAKRRSIRAKRVSILKFRFFSLKEPEVCLSSIQSRVEARFKNTKAIQNKRKHTTNTTSPQNAMD